MISKRLPQLIVGRPRATYLRKPSNRLFISSMTTSKTSHEERTAAEPRAQGLHDVRLSRIDQVNERVRLLRLDLIHGPVQFLPGQWLDTFVPSVPKAGGFTITSPPSLASSSNPNPYLELSVQESPSNPPAAWLWKPRDDILGQILKVRIGGSFTFPPQTGWQGKRVVFVAGGVGINPFMSMLSSISEDDKDLDVRVAYGTKVGGNGVADVVFAERIKGLYRDGKMKGVFRVLATGQSTSAQQATLSKEAQFEVHPRRISVQDVEDLVGPDEHDTTVVYVCGPRDMTDEFVAALTSEDKGLGLHPSQVLTEKWW